jgi:hypothetical protein
LGGQPVKNFERVDTRPGYDKYGKIVHMVTSGGYVMVKRPRTTPFVLSLKEWARISKTPDLFGPSESEGNGDE